ncbi:MAG: DUF3078 domain-containing protein [Candidatus Zixiibacteriota bacterium]|nr:MAG: DUF3078 domain-containing protein [candidate division Zixibacteria bacterium]
MLNSFRAPFVIALLATLATGAWAAEDDSTFVGWRKSLTADITITQTGYSDSWVGGEAGSVNWVSNLNGLAERQLEDWFNFKSTLKMSFGQTLTQDPETKDWSKPKKSTDLIDWENVGLFTLHKYIDPYAAFRLETQFFDGRHPDKKLYFSPLRLTESAGIARKFYKKNDDFVLSRFGLGIRETFKSVIVDPVTQATTDSTLVDGGLESVTDATLTLHENILYTGKLTLYKALFFSESDQVEGTQYEDDWKAVDVNWENILSAQVTKIITVSLYTQLLYDKEISKKGRFKETVAIGFVFKMM